MDVASAALEMMDGLVVWERGGREDLLQTGRYKEVPGVVDVGVVEEGVAATTGQPVV